MDKAKRAVISIAGIEVEVYQMPGGEYAMSQRQIGKAIDVQGVLILRFLDEKWLEGKLHKDYRNYKKATVNDSIGRGGNNNPIKPIPIDLASEFWLMQAIKGNLKAQALAKACLDEALERRCDKAFSVGKSEEEYESETSIKYQTWSESRSFLKDAHASFLNCCRANDFIASVAHDKITRAICGMTARELRELEVIEGSVRIGLNHIKDKNILVQVARLKLEFSRLRTGNVDERIAKALKML
jgi:hypothetical protein